MGGLEPRPRARASPRLFGLFRPLKVLCSLLVLTVVRVGEAKVHGPNTATWTVGVCNPSGLQGKQSVVSVVGADILALSETHLTKVAHRNLATSFRSSRSKFKHVLTGAPMAPRSTASDAGHWAGVAFASTVPCRVLPASWPADLFETGRIQFGAFYTPCAWISGAVIYGYPEGRNHLHAHARTEAILDFALQRMLAQPGPRFMAGDWNFAPDMLQVSTHLHAAGWIEVQDLAWTLHGRPIEHTCKGVSRKDHLWLSPELARGFLALDIDHMVFACFCRSLCPSCHLCWGFVPVGKVPMALSWPGFLVPSS